MREELQRLGEALYRPGPQSSAVIDLAAHAAETVVVLPAGGFGYRMRSVNEPEGAATQKSLLPLPNGETLIGRIIRQYAEAGFGQFVALLNYAGAEVEAHLDGGRPWGVEVRSSYDPESGGSGRTGAMVHAMDLGILPANAPAVVHNADCQIMRYEGSFTADLLRTHVAAVASGNVLATLAAVDGIVYPYTGMSVAGGLVREIAMYPFVPVPGHTGITVLTSEALASMRENARTSDKNFEQGLFPLWAAAGRLAAMVISHRSWAAVDDRKTYRVFSQAVADENRAEPSDQGDT
jgi:NDP-sugar pyrophosphorylase family protein